MTTSLYEILGIKKDATPEEVRKAYRRRALQTHPDRLPPNVTAADKEAAEEQFRLVNNAYEVLNNADNRKLYDKHGVWPPPTEQPDFGRRDAFGSMHDPFMDHPLFNRPFGPSRSRPFTFTDPFELFNSLFGDLHSAFDNDPFFSNTPFRSHFDDPFFRSPFGASPFGGRTGDPFGSMFGRSPFGGFLGGPMFPAIEDMPGGRFYSSSTEAIGTNGQWVSRSQMTRTINGRTEVITKRIDTQGNEHVTYSSPDGERYTINGIEQPSHGSIEGPRRSGTSSTGNPPPAIAGPAANPASPIQSYSVPIAGSSRNHAHSPVVPPLATQPVVPPLPQTVHPERRASRHSHRDRASVDEPYRSYSTRARDVPMPNEYASDPARDTKDKHRERDRERERRDSKLAKEHRSSRHSRDHPQPRDPVIPTPVAEARSAAQGDEDRRSSSSRDKEQRGWRGWLSSVLHPFRSRHQTEIDHKL